MATAGFGSIPVLKLADIRAALATGAGNLFPTIDAAFGPTGPGAVWIVGDDSFSSKVRRLRTQFLPKAKELALQPDDVCARLADPDSIITGLAKGIEATDVAKTSFYYHPVGDEPGNHLPSHQGFDKFWHSPNRFPSEEEMPGFKEASREAAQFVVSTGHELAQLMELRLQQVEGYKQGSLSNATEMTPGANHKARLICYHPYQNEEERTKSKGMWGAAHLDTGSLTGLLPGVFIDDSNTVVPNPDAHSGLYVVDRQGNEARVQPPAESDALLYQIGETLQIVSGGEMQATPHLIKGPEKADPTFPTRCALAVFMQPHPMDELHIPSSISPEQMASRTADRFLPPEWPTMEFRVAEMRKQGLIGDDKPLTFGAHGAVTFSNLKAQE